MKLKDNNIVLSSGEYNGEKVHKYISLDDGTEYVGITGDELLGQLFPLNVPESRKHYVVEAGRKGTLIHDALEDYLKDGKESETHGSFIKEYLRLALHESIAQEYTVQWGKFASNIDNVWKVTNRSVALVDYKTWKTKSDHLISTMWQLNIYKWIFEQNNPTIKVKNLYCMWLPSDMFDTYKRGEVIELPIIDKEIVSKLMEDANNGKKLSVPNIGLDGLVIPDADTHEIISREQIDSIAEIKFGYEKYNKEYKNVSNTLKAAMTNYGVKSIENDRFTATVSIPQNSTLDFEGLKEKYPKEVKEFCTLFDAKEFQKKYPELYADFSGKVDGSPKLTITLKK